jgi:ribulose-phosphate 3-epimerase
VETANRIKIAPSIAAADQSRLGWAVKVAARAGADLIHLDIEDGVFIPNITFGPAMVRALRPYTDLPFDVHVELAHPEPYLEELAIAGANTLTVHAEACLYLHRTVRLIHSLGLTAGVAFNAATPLDALYSVLDAIEVIHLMTADPDCAGARFIPALLDKIQEAAHIVGERPIAIEVDGDINRENARQVVQAGATILVVGRSVWSSSNPTHAIMELRAATYGHQE